MKTMLYLVALLVAGAMFAEDAPPAPLSPLAPLESLVGGLWVAQLPGPKDQPALALELRFAWTENRQSIRFESTWVRGEKRKPYTDGFYAWNTAKGKIAIFYTDSGGSLVEGLITSDGGTLVNDLVSTGPGGKLDLIKVQLTKEGADAFTNAIFVQKDDAWSPLVTVRYERKK